MIASANFQLTREIVERECIACGFYAPQIMQSARVCVHDSLMNGTCLGKKELESMTGVPIKEEHYYCEPMSEWPHSSSETKQIPH